MIFIYIIVIPYNTTFILLICRFGNTNKRYSLKSTAYFCVLYTIQYKSKKRHTMLHKGSQKIVCHRRKIYYNNNIFIIPYM